MPIEQSKRSRMRQRRGGAAAARTASRRSLVLAAALAVALAAGACSASPDAATGAAAPSGRGTLVGVCPATVVVQTNWFPQSEHGAAYRLVGPGYRIDAAHKRVTGPLVAGGQDTGVRIEVRAGGPAVGFQSSAALMYQDPGITLGMLQSDEIVQFSKTQPVVGVMAPLELDPQILLWDPKAHPDWHTIADIGQSDAQVLYFQGSAYMEYLVGAGILRRAQIDGRYDGSPSRFVASDGKIAVQGYATNEPYLYEHEVRAWGRAVAFQLIVDTGYPNYANVLSVRADQKAKLAPCLKRLVPMLQQAQVDFLRDPGRTLDLIVKLDQTYKGGFVYSPGLARFAVTQMRQLGIVDNGHDATLGNFDNDRMQHLINIDVPIFAGQHKPIRPNLTPGDVTTNEFIDPSISLR
jgi:hypothetical protein